MCSMILESLRSKGLAVLVAVMVFLWRYGKLEFTTVPASIQEEMTIDASELELISVLYPRQNISILNHVPSGDSRLWNPHVLYMGTNLGDSGGIQSSEATLSPSLPQMVLIHGYGTTAAIAWRKLLPNLHNHYEVFAINLPGFGRSPLPSSMMEAENEEQILHSYCLYFQQVWKSYGINTPYVVAHSFGGYLFLRCVSKHPHLASKLLLVDSPGFFSVNGGNDYFLAMLFFIGVPHRVLKTAGVYGRSIMKTSIDFLGLSFHPSLVNYWYLLQTSSLMQSEIIIGHFIKFYFFYAIGSGLSLVDFCNLQIPVALVYGEKDTLSPPHQGEFLHKLTGVQTYVLKNATHMPYAFEDGRPFFDIIRKADEEASHLPPHTRKLASCLQATISHWSSYPCLPLPFLSDMSLHRMYSSIEAVHKKCL